MLKIRADEWCEECGGSGVVLRAISNPATGNASRVVPSGGFIRAMGTHGAPLRFELCECLSVVDEVNAPKPKSKPKPKAKTPPAASVRTPAPAPLPQAKPLSPRHREALAKLEDGAVGDVGEELAQELFVLGVVDLQGGDLGQVRINDVGRRAMRAADG